MWDCTSIPFYSVKAWCPVKCRQLYLYIGGFGTSISCFQCGPGSSVGIATDYGLDGPRLNPGEDEIFRSSRLALGPNQPPVKWVLGLSRG